MLNQKGFSVVEVTVAFALASLMIFILLQATLFLREQYYAISLKSEVIITQSILLNR